MGEGSKILRVTIKARSVAILNQKETRAKALIKAHCSGAKYTGWDVNLENDNDNGVGEWNFFYLVPSCYVQEVCELLARESFIATITN